MQLPHTEAAPASEPPRVSVPSPGKRTERGDSGGRRLQRKRNRLAWYLIAPALTFMLLVHVLPTLAGVYVSFLRLNTFTLPQLFGAPWYGLQNYKDLFDSASPINAGFYQAAKNTASTPRSWWWARWRAGWASPCFSTAPSPAGGSCGR